MPHEGERLRWSQERSPIPLQLDRSLNWPAQALLLVTLSLLCIGIVMVPSAVATATQTGPWHSLCSVRHVIYAGTAILGLFLFWRLNYGFLNWGKVAPWLAAALLAAALACAVLVYAPGVGVAKGGRYRAIHLIPSLRIGFQPSELIKIALVVFLAAWLSRPKTDLRSFWRTFVPAVGLIGLSVGLIIREDFGASMVIALAATVTLFFAGIPLGRLLCLPLFGAAGFYVFVVRSVHRWERIRGWLNPWDETCASAYQPRQALLTIMSGNWLGCGPGNGLNRLGFLPEDSTDFLFSVLCEEWGFLGAMLLIALLASWILLARRASVRTADPFGRLLAASLGFVIGAQAALHVAVNLGALPPTGMGMPFVSAGGSRLLIMSAAAAMIVSVASRPVPEALEAEPPGYLVPDDPLSPGLAAT